MTYGSVCSGIEAATEAWKGLGWRCAFVAEVEPFPCAVLRERLGATRPARPLDPREVPEGAERRRRKSWLRGLAHVRGGGSLPNHGDFTKIAGSDIGTGIDLLVGGTPCQAFSAAGLKEGLEDERGMLALEFARLAFRSGCRWVVWENVTGVLAGRGGRDFARLLSALCGWEVSVPEGGWGNSGVCTGAPGHFGVAWRVLDAQYTRVPEFPGALPQRRRRVILVGRLGSWERAAEVLFEGELRGGDTPPRREEGAVHAPDVQAGAGDPLGEDADRGGRAACLPVDMTNFDGRERRGYIGCVGSDGDAAYPLTRRRPSAVCTDANGPVPLVRYLLPVEAERIMGFPDGYTAVPWKGRAAEDCPDGPRYRALGNSMCVNVMAWVGRRIDEAEGKEARGDAG